MAGMTTMQASALFGIAMGEGLHGVVDARPVLRGSWQVSAHDGRRWLIDETGRVHSGVQHNGLDVAA